MTKWIALIASAAVIALCAAAAGAHEGEGGEPSHDGVRPDGSWGWHTHGPSPEERAAQLKRACEAKRVSMRLKANEWNRREAAAWAELQEACADESPVGQAQCEYRSRMYQANYSPSEAADFQQWLLSEIAAACAAPKSREEIQCERLAQAMGGARSRRNDKGVAYWTQRAAEAGCI